MAIGIAKKMKEKIADKLDLQFHTANSEMA